MNGLLHELPTELPRTRHIPGPGTGSRIVVALERAWEAIRARHPDVPPAIITTGSGAGDERLRLGHFASSRWVHNGAEYPEIFISGECMAKGHKVVLATLIHEAAHAAAHVRGIRDTAGPFHLKTFKRMAEDEFGLEIGFDKRIGHSPTALPEATARGYADTLEELGRVFPRIEAPPIRRGTKRRTNRGVLIFAVCAVFWALVQLAPHPQHEPVSSGSFKPQPVTGLECGNFGGGKIISAVMIDNAGPAPLYQITCADGVTFQTTK